MASGLQASQSPIPSQNSTSTKTTNWPLIAVAIGIILGLAGLFLTLAAHQILPHGVNAISDLGIWGRVSGYCGLGIGFITTLIGLVKWYLNTHIEKINISKEVKNSLDLLLGKTGAVNNLPEYPEIPCEEPTLTGMQAPIMKGLFRDGRPFVALKVKCISNKEELKAEWKTEATEQLIVLFQPLIDGKLWEIGEAKNYWQQLDNPPCFFRGNFTYAESGELVLSQTKNFGLLQKLIADGEGEDPRGVRWKIDKG